MLNLKFTDLEPIRKHELPVVLEDLDVGENIVPSPAIQSNDVIPQSVDDLVRLKSRKLSKRL